MNRHYEERALELRAEIEAGAEAAQVRDNPAVIRVLNRVKERAISIWLSTGVGVEKDIAERERAHRIAGSTDQILKEIDYFADAGARAQSDLNKLKG